jgi:hypothetical protein
MAFRIGRPLAFTAVSVVLGLSLPGCWLFQKGKTTPDAGTDAGPGMPDAGPPPDAGSCGLYGLGCCDPDSGFASCAGDGGIACRSGECLYTGTGTPCTTGSSCPSGVCLSLGQGQGVCTEPCSSDGDCVAGWTCGALAGQSGNYCHCAPQTEMCNDKDDDCNGVIDDEPASDTWCKQQGGPGQICHNGACTCALTCGVQCVDPRMNNQNCGGCNQPCPPTATCTDGTCVCPNGGSACSGACVNEQTDVNHCGGCTNVCVSDQSCDTGACTCPNGGSVCSGDCVDKQTDTNNCGTCGNVCPAVASCTGGSCACPSEMVVCGTSCVNEQFDSSNCGTCGMSCDYGVCENALCVSGWAQWTVPADAPPDGNFQISLDLQAVTDSVTGLYWQRTPPSQTYSQIGAETYCQSLSLGAFGSGWRLPTIMELVSIVDYSRYSPAIDQNAFPGTVSGIFWSSSPEPNLGGGTGAAINFRDGAVTGGPVAQMEAVRCVH